MDDERIIELLRLLPPAPQGWVEAAWEIGDWPTDAEADADAEHAGDEEGLQGAGCADDSDYTPDDMVDSEDSDGADGASEADDTDPWSV